MSGSMVEVIGSSTTPRMGRRSMALADIDPKYVSQSGIWEASEVETSRGSIRIQHLVSAVPTGSRASSTSAASTSVAISSGNNPRFPKLEECAHFHYDCVELPTLKIQIRDDPSKPISSNADEPLEKCAFSIEVTSGGQSWAIRRTHANLFMLDEQLHRCVWDRSFSLLEKVVDKPSPIVATSSSSTTSHPSKVLSSTGTTSNIDEQQCHNECREFVTRYLARLSDLPTNKITCGTVLSWLELDNRGRHIVSSDDSAINTPAVAAAHAVRKYSAQAPDEISFEVGDMISVIDMPPPEESIWWRGKRGFHVGFFPRDYVEVIGDKIPAGLPVVPSVRRLQRLSVTSSSSNSTTAPDKPVLRKHGKLIAFFRSFILSRPSRRRLKQSGILRERVFSCDLAEHLLNSGNEIPTVLLCCAEFIEKHGIVDGVYRLSGITSNIQKLRNAFDEDKVPNLEGDAAIKQDIHAVSSLLKMYFRELPNPLCTYQLYEKFVAAAKSSDEERLFKMREVVHELPPPHYRTLQYLMKHLSRVAQCSKDTGMTPKNMAIVWAPNLIRCRELEAGGVAALKGIGVQAVVTEYLIRHADLIFNDKLPSNYPTTTTVLSHRASSGPSGRPKSLAISSSPMKLMSLEEAQERIRDDRKFIDVGGGPSSLPPKYHTVIELPGRRGAGGKSKRSPMGWKHFFSRNRSFSKPQRKTFTPGDITVITRSMPVAGPQGMQTNWAGRLRPVKSVESLVSSPLYNNHASTNGNNEMSSPVRGKCDRDLDSASVMEEMESSLSKSSPATPTAALTDVHVMFHHPPASTLMNGNDPRMNPKTHNRSISHDSYFEFGEFRNGNPVYIDETLEEETMSQESSSKLSLEGLSSGVESSLASPGIYKGAGSCGMRSKSEERERFKRSSPVTPPPSVASLIVPIASNDGMSNCGSSGDESVSRHASSSPIAIKPKVRPSKWRDSEVQTSNTKLSDVGVSTHEDMISLLYGTTQTKSVATSSLSLSQLQDRGSSDNNTTSKYELDKNSSFEDESSEMSTPEDGQYCSTNIIYSPLVNEISSTSSAEQFDPNSKEVLHEPKANKAGAMSLFVCPLYEAGVTPSEVKCSLAPDYGLTEAHCNRLQAAPECLPSEKEKQVPAVVSPVYENVSKVIQSKSSSSPSQLTNVTESQPVEEQHNAPHIYANDRIYQNDPIAPARKRPTTLLTTTSSSSFIEKESTSAPSLPHNLEAVGAVGGITETSEELYSGEHYENISESDYSKSCAEGNIYEDIDESETNLGRYETIDVPQNQTIVITPPIAPPRSISNNTSLNRQQSEEEETHYESVRFYNKIDENVKKHSGQQQTLPPVINHYSEIEENPSKIEQSPVALSPISPGGASSASPSSPSNSRTDDMVTYLEVQTPSMKLFQTDSLEEPEQSFSSSSNSASATKEPETGLTPQGDRTPAGNESNESQSSSSVATPNSSTEEEGEIRHIDSPLVVENPLYSLQLVGDSDIQYIGNQEEENDISMNESISIGLDTGVVPDELPFDTGDKSALEYVNNKRCELKPLGRCSSAPLSETKHDFIIVTEDMLSQSNDQESKSLETVIGQDDGDTKEVSESTQHLSAAPAKISLCKRMSEPSLSSAIVKTDKDGPSGVGNAWKVADAKRLANRKQSVKELLSKFEGRRDSPSPSSPPGTGPGLPKPSGKNSPSSNGSRSSLNKAFGCNGGSARFQHHRFSVGDILMTQSMSSAEDLPSIGVRSKCSMVRSDTYPELRSKEGSGSASKENVLVEVGSGSDSLEDGGLVPEKIQQALRVAMSSVDMNDPSTRERIEKYKEERRTFLRQKVNEGISPKSPTSPTEVKDPNKHSPDGSYSSIESVFSSSKVTTTTINSSSTGNNGNDNSSNEASTVKLPNSESPRKRAFSEDIPVLYSNSTKSIKTEESSIPLVAKLYSSIGESVQKRHTKSPEQEASPQDEINVKEKIAMWTLQKKNEISRSTRSCTEITKEVVVSRQKSPLVSKDLESKPVNVKPILRREVTTSSIEIKSKMTRVTGATTGGGGSVTSLGRSESGKKIKDMAAFFEGKKF